MKKKVRSSLSIVLALVMVLSTVTLVSAEGSDYAGHWAESEITTWVEAGIINGYPDGTFKPNNAVTRAEFVTMLNNLFGYVDVANNEYSDVDADAWYADAVLKATAAGVMQGNNKLFRPMNEISRQEAAVALYNAFKMEAQAEKNYKAFDDSAAVASWAAEQVNALVVDGYMSGRGGNNLAATDSITRAEALKLIDNIAGELAMKSVSTSVAGNLFITEADTVVKDVTIKGNVYIAQSVGEGDVTFDRVTVEGEIVALGGGENTVKLIDTTVTKITVSKADGKIRLLVSGKTSVGTVKAESGVKLEEENLDSGSKGFNVVEVVVEEGSEEIVDGDGNVVARVDNNEIILVGNFEEVAVEASDVELKVERGTIAKMNVSEDAEGAKIEVSANVIVKEMEVNAKVEVAGDGKIEQATIAAEGTKFENEPDAVEIDEEITVVIGGEEKTSDDNHEAEEDTSTGSTGSTGSGSTGGSTTTYVNKTFYLSGASNNPEPFTIRLEDDATSNEIAAELLDEITEAKFNELYDSYNTSLNGEREDNFLILGLDWVTYANQQDGDLDGTMFEALVPTFNAQYDTEDARKKAILWDALTVIKANVNDFDAIRDDLITIANKVQFSEIEFRNEPFIDAMLVEQNNPEVIVWYPKTDSKAYGITAVFDELKNLTMDSSLTYYLTVQYGDDKDNPSGTRTATLSTN